MSEDITLQAIALAEEMRKCPETEKLIMDSAENLLQVTPANTYTFAAHEKAVEQRRDYEKELFEKASKIIGKTVTSTQVINLACALLTPPSAYESLGE
jgi:hypothetical protein